jgi:hypothetical protein
MSSFYELRVVHHPEAAKVVFIADKALVQRQVRADGILDGRRCAEDVRRRDKKEKGKEG